MPPAALPWVWDDKNWESLKEPWYNFSGKTPRLIADALADELVTYLPSIYYGNTWYMYQNGVYRSLSEDYIKDLISGFLRKGYVNTRSINEVYEIWRLRISIDNEAALNSNRFIVNVLNGLYDFRSGVLLPHSDNYKSTIQLNVEYKSYAECPTFLEFLREVIDPEDIPVLQEYIGYCMTKWTNCERCLILYGAPRSGKSTILRVLNDILGDLNTTHIAIQNLEDRFKTAQLQNRLLNIFYDLPSKPLEDAGVLKALISGEPIVVENKGKTPYTMHPYAKMMFSTNQIPRIKDHTGALARRLLIIPFETTVPVDKVDMGLKGKLLKEKSGIFNWAMEGLRRLIQNNYQFSESKSGKEALDKYVTESDNVLAFISECVQLNPDCHCYCRAIYGDYITWCEKSGYGKTFVSMPRFNDTIIRRFGSSIRKCEENSTRRAIWKGITYQLPDFSSLEERVSRPMDPEDLDDLKDW